MTQSEIIVDVIVDVLVLLFLIEEWHLIHVQGVGTFGGTSEGMEHFCDAVAFSSVVKCGVLLNPPFGHHEWIRILFMLTSTDLPDSSCPRAVPELPR